METSTNLRQVQSLSPQMLQTLALLPMSVTELNEFILEEIEKNPALEIPDSGCRSLEELQEKNYGNQFSDFDEDSKQRALENTPVKGESLEEHLLTQLGESEIPQRQREICEYLIGNLDDNGFHIVKLNELFEGKDYQEEEINKAIEVVQSFEPYGICVSDFRQSLILQAKCSGMQKSDLEIFSLLVNNYLEKIKDGKHKEVSALLHISQEDLEAFLSILTTFSPYPGRAFDNSQISVAIPEFSIHKIDGSLVLQVNRENLPDIVISEDFSKLSSNLSGPEAKEANSYIKDSIRKAQSLISQVNMRYQTLYKTAEVLIKKQSDFFMNGPAYLRTLTLQDVADEIGVHETTISRLAQNKWVETDWGIFQLKYFFSQGVGEVSRNSVKTVISEILKENPKLSDQKVSDILKEKGISCARRTVNKYRAELQLQ